MWFSQRHECDICHECNISYYKFGKSECQFENNFLTGTHWLAGMNGGLLKDLVCVRPVGGVWGLWNMVFIVAICFIMHSKIICVNIIIVIR